MTDQIFDLGMPAPETEPDRQAYFVQKAAQYVRKEAEKAGRDLTFCVNTFGCQMNARDSEKLAGILERIGYVESDSEESDFVVYNTCTVRENANTRVYGRLGTLKTYKKANPYMKIALCGCMMQEAHVVEKIKESYKHVDIIFGTHNIFKLAELVCRSFEQEGMLIDIWKDTDKIVEELPSVRKFAFKSGVNISFGCNNFCTYCIVPYVRGRERSRKPEDILAECRKLASEGVVEVMLLGQNVNSYGKELAEPITFAQLLREVEKIEGIERIRFMTSHPKDLSDELIEAIRDCRKVVHHFHLPLQSGSSRILKLMNRRYDKERYLERVARIREIIPDISLTTDIIVGFPGETEEDFLETIDVVKKVRYDSAFTFQYSRRTGTPAAIMEDQISEEVMKDRFDRLLEVVQQIGREQSSRFEGTVQEVLVEEVNHQDASMLTGRMGNNLLVHFPGDPCMIGKIARVRLSESKGFYYLGELEEN